MPGNGRWYAEASPKTSPCKGGHAGETRAPRCDAREHAGETRAPRGAARRERAADGGVLTGSVLGRDARFVAFPRLLPLIPPAPFSHTGRRGSLGVLMPETEDWHAGACQKIYPCERLPSPTVSGDALGARASGAQAGETPALPGSASVDRNSFRSPAIAIAPQCSYTGRRGRVGVLKFEMGDGAQGLPENLASARLHAGETTALPGGASVDRNSFRSPAIAIAPQCSHTERRGRVGVLTAEMGDGTQGLAKKSIPVSDSLLPL